MNKQKRIWILLATLLICSLVFSSAWAMASPNFLLGWFINLHSSGGGGLISDNYQADVTLGQSFIGQATSPQYQAQTGYWVPWVKDWLLLLPLLLKGTP